MLSVAPIAKNAENYYTAQDNYYFLGHAGSRWLGKGAEALGLTGEVSKEQLREILAGRLPEGSSLERMENGKNTHRQGHDLTFSAPKSVSVLAVVLGDERMLAAHNAAVTAALKETETLASTRVMKDGTSAPVMTGNLVIAAFNHDTSRELDPQLHTHALVMNMTAHEGQWRTLSSDTRHNSGFSEAVYKTRISLGRIYLHELRQQVEKMGFKTHDTGRNGLWEIEGIPVAPFSQRRQQILDAAGDDASLKSRDVAALDTRQAKRTPDKAELLTEWYDRLDKNGFGSEERSRFNTAAQSREQDSLTPPPLPAALQKAADAALTEAVNALSERQVSMTYSAVLAKTLSGLDARPGIITVVRNAIDRAIEQRQLIPLDEQKGLFTSAAHLTDELTLQQLAAEVRTENRTPVFRVPDTPFTGTAQKLADTLPNAAVIDSRGNRQMQRDRLAETAAVALQQGRTVLVIEADSKHTPEPVSGTLSTDKRRWTEKPALPVNGTVIVTGAETWSLKETVQLFAQAKETNTQILLLDSAGRKGTGNALRTLEDAGVVRFAAAGKPPVQTEIHSIGDKQQRYAAVAARYQALRREGGPVTVQVTGTRERAALTDAVRAELTAQGVLQGSPVSVTLLTPVWSDSKTRRDISQYREGMILEQWQDGKKSVERFTVTRVTPATRSVTLEDRRGQSQVIKVTKLDSSWSLFHPAQKAIAAGETLTLLAKHGRMAAGDTLTVMAVTDSTLTAAHRGRRVTLPLTAGLKADYAYVTTPGQPLPDNQVVLAAASVRDTRADFFNTVARSGEKVELFTPLDNTETDRRLARSPHYQTVAARLGTDPQEPDTSVRQAAERLWSVPEKAVRQGIVLTQENQVMFSVTDVVAKTLPLHPSLTAESIRLQTAKMAAAGELISVPGSGKNEYVTAAAWESEKQIIRAILQGKGTQQPFFERVPEAMLAGLTPGQQAATRLILESTDRFIAVQGYAGVGKTTQFKAVMRSLDLLPEASRPEVRGLAPTHRAAGEMAATGVKAQTLQSFLTDTAQQLRNGETPRFDNTLFLIDESSMIGNRNMAEVVAVIEAGGGRAVKSGDTAQLQAIDSGTPFELTQTRSALNTAIMKEIVRQTPALKPAVEAVIAGQMKQAAALLENVSPAIVPRLPDAHIPEKSVMQAGEDGVIRDIVRDYSSRTPEAREKTLIVVQTNADRAAVNAGVHEALTAGEGVRKVRIPVLVQEKTQTASLHSVAGLAQHHGKTVLAGDTYYTLIVTERDNADGVVMLRDADNRDIPLSAFENSSRDIQVFRTETREMAEGEKVTFTRTDRNRGRVVNSTRTVSQIHDDGTLTLTDGQDSIRINPAEPADRHIDYGYAGTAHKAQGASEEYVIVLGGVTGGRRPLASRRNAYVALSRMKTHVQVYSDNLEKWLDKTGSNAARPTVHDLLMADSDRAAGTGNLLYAGAKTLTDTAVGRALSRELGLTAESTARFVYGSQKYPEPGVAWPVYDRHGRPAGTRITPVLLNEQGHLNGAGQEQRRVGREEAVWMVLQRGSNGETRIAESMTEALAQLKQTPDSGVVVRLQPEEPVNAAVMRKLTGGLPADLSVPDMLRAGVPAADDPITLKTAEEQRREAELKAAALPEKADTVRDTPPDARLDAEIVREQQRLQSQENTHDRKAAVSLDEILRQEQLHRMRQTEQLQQAEKDIIREREPVREKEIGE
ncbi:TPA: conjugative transfer relaxase/helicase TraI [Morganella morganii]